MLVSHKPFTSMSWLSSTINSWKGESNVETFFRVQAVGMDSLGVYLKKNMWITEFFGWNRIMMVYYIFDALMIVLVHHLIGVSLMNKAMMQSEI